MREDRKIKMLDVATHLGVPLSSAYRWHSRAARPEPEVLQRLLTFYNASPADQFLAWQLRATAPRVATNPGDEEAAAATPSPDAEEEEVTQVIERPRRRRGAA
jgi:transcriptional regulator with XRE-family HTH domain